MKNIYNMSDEELIAYEYNAADGNGTTDLASELSSRFERLKTINSVSFLVNSLINTVHSQNKKAGWWDDQIELAMVIVYLVKKKIERMKLKCKRLKD